MFVVVMNCDVVRGGPGFEHTREPDQPKPRKSELVQVVGLGRFLEL